MSTTDLICFSHLRWDFVFQRPQHILSRFVGRQRVFFFEEPLIVGLVETAYDIIETQEGVVRIIPLVLLEDSQRDNAVSRQKAVLHDVLQRYEIHHYMSWYYTANALRFSADLRPIVTIYDCMDELSAFKGSCEQLPALEKKLLGQADIVFTGGHSLYESKRTQHANVHALPSSVDAQHFGQARTLPDGMVDQSSLAHPRIGFYGVIDERFDIGLLDALARLRPEYQFVIVGPIVKIESSLLPKLDNVHYLGPKSYAELPHLLAGWDVAMMPFAKNEATRYISPTKTLEYLAAGKQVVSTSIHDVVSTYGAAGVVHIADQPEAFAQAIDHILLAKGDPAWMARADHLLAQTSWDMTWQKMQDQIELQLQKNSTSSSPKL